MMSITLTMNASYTIIKLQLNSYPKNFSFLRGHHREHAQHPFVKIIQETLVALGSSVSGSTYNENGIKS